MRVVLLTDRLFHNRRIYILFYIAATTAVVPFHVRFPVDDHGIAGGVWYKAPGRFDRVRLRRGPNGRRKRLIGVKIGADKRPRVAVDSAAIQVEVWANLATGPVRLEHEDLEAGGEDRQVPAEDQREVPAEGVELDGLGDGRAAFNGPSVDARHGQGLPVGEGVVDIGVSREDAHGEGNEVTDAKPPKHIQRPIRINEKKGF